jgi:prevent-host-death family protein
MRTVSTVEARQRWAELLTMVSKGESVCISRCGAPIAKLVPLESETSNPTKVLELFRESRKGASLQCAKIRELINEGRRF